MKRGGDVRVGEKDGFGRAVHTQRERERELIVRTLMATVAKIPPPKQLNH